MGPAAFMGCSRLQEVIIPPVVKLIPDDCFDGCESLCQVVLPDGLQRIGNCAFRTCRELTEIHLPATVTGLCSFDGCSSLREIEIPAGMERVEGFMFCHSLQRVILHAGVRSILLQRAPMASQVPKHTSRDRTCGLRLLPAATQTADIHAQGDDNGQRCIPARLRA